MAEMVDVYQYQEFAEDVELLAGVAAADVLDRDPRVNRPLVEVTVGPAYVRVPPRVFRRIAEHDLGVRSVKPRVDGWFTIEVV